MKLIDHLRSAVFQFKLIVNELIDYVDNVLSSLWIKLFNKDPVIKDRELWNLDVTIAKFTLPRLKRFRKISPFSYDEKTNHELDEIEWFLEKKINFDTRESKRQQQALKYLADNFNRLWW